MTKRLEGKFCFVTGAAQGIGRSIARQFAYEGARVIGADLVFHQADQDGFEQVTLDVTDAAAVNEAASRWSEVAVLVNCVGFVANGAILDCTQDDFDRSMRVNVGSMFNTIQAFLPAMLDRGSGAIVNIASVVSTVKAAPNRFAYATSKAAVLGLTTSVAMDYVTRGIRCNAISPGTIETSSLETRLAANGDVETARRAFIARQPMGRLGGPDEIASAAVFLASDEARFMTGANVIIDGGMSL